MKYRKKPVVVEAIQFNGKNYLDCTYFLGDNFCNKVNYPNVTTLHGTVRVDPGDWLLKSEFGDYWPCKPDIFEKTYELVERVDVEALEEVEE